MTAAADFRPEPPARPDPPGPAGEGREWAAEPEDIRRWALAWDGATCRSRVPGEGEAPAHACGNATGVRKLVGVGRPVWWNLCVPLHSEGRWPEDGKVMHWVLREAKT